MRDGDEFYDHTEVSEGGVDPAQADAEAGFEVDAVDFELDNAENRRASEFDTVAAQRSGWQPPVPTGVQSVDDAVAMLVELDELPTAEHVAFYESVHRHLQDALADLDGA